MQTGSYIVGDNIHMSKPVFWESKKFITNLSSIEPDQSVLKVKICSFEFQPNNLKWSCILNMKLADISVMTILNPKIIQDSGW